MSAPGPLPSTSTYPINRLFDWQLPDLRDGLAFVRDMITYLLPASFSNIPPLDGLRFNTGNASGEISIGETDATAGNLSTEPAFAADISEDWVLAEEPVIEPSFRYEELTGNEQTVDSLAEETMNNILGFLELENLESQLRLTLDPRLLINRLFHNPNFRNQITDLFLKDNKLIFQELLLRLSTTSTGWGIIYFLALLNQFLPDLSNLLIIDKRKQDTLIVRYTQLAGEKELQRNFFNQFGSFLNLAQPSRATALFEGYILNVNLLEELNLLDNLYCHENLDYVRRLVASNDVEMLRTIHNRGFELGFLDQRGNTLLHTAVTNESLEVVNFLIDVAQIRDQNNHNGVTARDFANALYNTHYAYYRNSRGHQIMTKLNRKGKNPLNPQNNTDSNDEHSKDFPKYFS